MSRYVYKPWPKWLVGSDGSRRVFPSREAADEHTSLTGIAWLTVDEALAAEKAASGVPEGVAVHAKFDPLDGDGDGRKGGSPPAIPDDFESLKWWPIAKLAAAYNGGVNPKNKPEAVAILKKAKGL